MQRLSKTSDLYSGEVIFVATFKEGFSLPTANTEVLSRALELHLQ